MSTTCLSFDSRGRTNGDNYEAYFVWMILCEYVQHALSKWAEMNISTSTVPSDDIRRIGFAPYEKLFVEMILYEYFYNNPAPDCRLKN